jgi:hypothetical protein
MTGNWKLSGNWKHEIVAKNSVSGNKMGESVGTKIEPE